MRWREAAEPGTCRGVGIGVLRREERHRTLGVRSRRADESRQGRWSTAGAPRSARASRRCSLRSAPTRSGVAYDDVTVLHGDTALRARRHGRIRQPGGDARRERGPPGRGAAARANPRGRLARARDRPGRPRDPRRPGRPPAAHRRAAFRSRRSSSRRDLPGHLPHGVEPRLSEEAYFLSEDMTLSVRGALHRGGRGRPGDRRRTRIERYVVAYDVGRAINPMLVEGQIVGGAAQGIGRGTARGARLRRGRDSSLSGSLHGLPPPDGRARSHRRRARHRGRADAAQPARRQGRRGGRHGGGGAAIANAVSDALGAEATSLPLTPEHRRRARADGRPS